MKLQGFYQDGTVISRGSFGVVYIVPLEDRVAAILEKDGTRKYLARERLLALVTVNKTLSYTTDFDQDDFTALFNEYELNSRFTVQGGWNASTGVADGVHTSYIKAFTGQYIQTPEMLADTTKTELFSTVVASAAFVQARQAQKPTGFKGLVKELTNWNL